jgi:D-tyrosyl-tRNA(Tyr) deacylase
LAGAQPERGADLRKAPQATFRQWRMMIALIQRVTRADVTVESQTVGSIGRGILALIGVRRGDDTASADRLLERLLTYRIFPDEQGKMNLSLRDTQGELLLVSQFTLAADTHKGTRAGFSTAAAPEEARRLFDHILARARASHRTVAAGVFGANMQVSLVNDGPVTFWLETPGANVDR